MSRLKAESPDYYLYQKDGIWFKTDDALTKQINRRILGDKAVKLPRIAFYPNWNSEGRQSAKYAAWRVNEFGEQVVRWYWKIQEHSKKCKGCFKLDSGRCGIKAIAMIEWNKVANCWQLAPMSYKASDEEAKVLDKM